VASMHLGQDIEVVHAAMLHALRTRGIDPSDEDAIREHFSRPLSEGQMVVVTDDDPDAAP